MQYVKAKIETIKTARARWAELSYADKRLIIELAEHWHLTDLLPKHYNNDKD